MARLPQPGGDDGDWGNILNNYLSQALKPDGTIKDSSISTSAIAPGAVTSAHIADTSVSTAKIADANITLAKLSSEVQASLDRANTAVQAATRPLAASYRPLKGVTAAITSSLTSGEVSSNNFYPWSSASNHYRFVGCEPTAFDDPTLGVNFNVGLDDAYIGNTIEIEFWSNATTIRAVFYNIGRADVWAIVDDMRINDGTYQHADFSDGLCTWELTQSTPVWRKWRLGLPATTFKGVGTNSGARIGPTAKGFQMAVIGDSYVIGGQNIANAIAPGASGVISAGATFGEMAQETGIDIWRLGVSGTGYVNDAGHGAGRGAYGSSSRMSAFANIPSMDAIVVWGTANDKSYQPTTVTAAAQSHWAAIHAARPNTPIIVIGPQCTGWPDAAMDNLNDALRVAANSDSNITAYVDLRNRNFMSGTGYDGSFQGDGNSDFFVSTDSAHLTHPGARYWGQNIARLLGTVVIPANPHNGSF